jgi:hypothetical protein
MARQLNQREKRVIQLGAVAAVAILAFTYGADWFDGWGKARSAIAASNRQLQDVRADRAKQEALLAIVPACEPPQPEEKQKFLFRDRLHEQLTKAGVKTEPLDILPVRKTTQVPYGVLKIKCKGKCKFEQLLDFLAALNENPYLVGVEELRVQCEPKEEPEKRKEIQFDLTVSTFVK